MSTSRPSPVLIAADETSFRIIRGPQVTRFVLSEVREIATYKRDLFTTDLICLALRVSDNDDWIELNEEDWGFSEFCEAMKAQFGAIPSNWYEQVMLPAFLPNRHVLWKRA